MRIVCIGGGPAGLYFGLLMKTLHPAHDIEVVERNRPYDTFGWGVVFSDATMEAMKIWDPQTAAEIQSAFNHWDDIELLFKGRRIRTTGHGFVGIGRKKLLNILQARCEALGVRLTFEREVSSDLEFPDADLIIASDGASSRVRDRYKAVFEPDFVVRPNRYIWLGTDKAFDAFTFDFRKTEHGWFQAHIYKFDDKTSTFIVETTEQTYKAHGLDKLGQEASIGFCENLFAETLDGAKLMTNARHQRGSQWLNFNRLICGRWSHFNGRSHVVLMGDAAHTAHFAIGSGTKLAIDDAIELARQFERLGHDRDQHPGRARGLRRGPPGRCRPHPERGPQRHGMVRGGRRTLCGRARARAVHVFHADALAAHQPRKPAPARQDVARGLRALVRREGGDRRRGGHAPGAAGVHALQGARRDAAPIASSSRRWRCIPQSTACRATSISSISARARWGALASSSRR